MSTFKFTKHKSKLTKVELSIGEIYLMEPKVKDLPSKDQGVDSILSFFKTLIVDSKGKAYDNQEEIIEMITVTDLELINSALEQGGMRS